MLSIKTSIQLVRSSLLFARVRVLEICAFILSMITAYYQFFHQKIDFKVVNNSFEYKFSSEKINRETDLVFVDSVSHLSFINNGNMYVSISNMVAYSKSKSRESSDVVVEDLCGAGDSFERFMIREYKYDGVIYSGPLAVPPGKMVNVSAIIDPIIVGNYFELAETKSVIDVCLYIETLDMNGNIHNKNIKISRVFAGTGPGRDTFQRVTPHVLVE